MTEAPLHPRRIAAALAWLKEATEYDTGRMEDETRATCIAALKLLHKAQRSTGLTPEVADVGSHVLGVLDYVKKGLARK